MAVPSRKALELVRLADPHLPFIAVSPHLRRGNLSAVLRGVPDGVPSVPDLSELHNVLTRELEQARMRRRVGGAHRLLAAQQAIADHLAAGLEPDALCDRVLSTLGESLGLALRRRLAPGRRPAALRDAVAVRRRPLGRDRARGRHARPHVRRRPGSRRPRLGLPPPGLVTRAARRGGARRARHRGGVPDRARRRVRRRDRALRRRGARAQRRGRGAVRHRRRPARLLPRPPPRPCPRPPQLRRRRGADRRARRARPRRDRQRHRVPVRSASRSATCSAATGSRSPCPSPSAPPPARPSRACSPARAPSSPGTPDVQLALVALARHRRHADRRARLGGARALP